VETIIRGEGWTKAAVMKMRKLDSFLKESMRLNPLGFGTQPTPFLLNPSTLAITNLGTVSTTRDVIVPNGYTFRNGVTLPQGSVVATTLYPIHMDETIYPKPNEFDGFRFSRMREQEGESAKHHASNTSHEYLNFGHGQHAW
jgi:hypothetical protein